MASVLKDTQYYGLDDGYTGDGTSDSSTRSISEYMERRFHQNNRYIKSKGWSVCYTPYTPGAGSGRRLSSLFTATTGGGIGENSPQGTFLFFVPIFLNEDTEKIRLSMDGNVNTALNVGEDDYADSDIAVRVTGYIFKTHQPPGSLNNYLSKNTKDWRSNESGDVDAPYEIEVSVDREKITSESRATVAFAFTSLSAKRSGKEGTPGDPDFYNWKAVQWDDDDIGSIDEDEYIVITNVSVDSDESGSDWFQTYRTFPTSDGHTVTFMVAESNRHVYGDEDVDGISTYRMNAIEPSSWHLEMFHRKDEDFDRFSNLPQTELNPNRTVEGKTVGKHAINTDQNYKRKRLKAIGPNGNAADSSINLAEWPTGKQPRWNWLTLDNTEDAKETSGIDSISESSELCRSTFRVDKGASRIKVIGYYSLFHLEKLTQRLFYGPTTTSLIHRGANQKSWGDTPSFDAKSSIRLGLSLQQRGSTGEVGTIEDGVAFGESSKQSNNDIKVFRPSWNNAFPMARTIFDAFFFDDTKNWDKLNKDSSFHFVHREGWIDIRDMKPGQINKFDIEATIPDDDTTNFDRPFIAKPYLWEADVEGQDSQNDITQSDVIMVVLQTAYWEMNE